MFKNRLFVGLVAFATAFVITSDVKSADDETKKKEAKKFTAVCPVSGAPAKEASALKYKEGKVHFCCDNCPKAFDAKKEEHAIKANYQLVQTRQYRQIGCPFSGKEIDKEKTSRIELTKGDKSLAKIRVSFCCDGCKTKVDGADSDKQLAMIFNNESFKKAFAKRGPKKAKVGLVPQQLPAEPRALGKGTLVPQPE